MLNIHTKLLCRLDRNRTGLADQTVCGMDQPVFIEKL